MVPVTSLWMPIVLSAVIVFVASSIIHMLLAYHRGDLRKVANEDELLDALRRLNLPPGDYGAPNPGSMEGMRSPEFVAKMNKGPVVLMTVVPAGPPRIGKNLVMWFIYSLVVGVFSALIAGGELSPGARTAAVFHFVSLSAFMGYGLALAQFSIWYSRNWVTTLKSMFDGLIYALLTAGTFVWLWPR